MPDVEIREATADDGAALAALAAASTDGGAVAFRMTEHVTGYEEPGRGTTRFVAELPGAGVVGTAALTTGVFRYDGGPRPFGLLHSLAVAPGHRRKGVAAALGRVRIERAMDAGGPATVVFADIQKGNAASLAAARRWATGFTGPQVTFPAAMRRRPPRPTDGLALREAASGDLTAIAAGVTAFAADRDFSRVWTAGSLAAWLGSTPVDEPIHICRVAVAASGAIVAGIAVRDDGRLRSMSIAHVPAAIRVANAVLHVIPPDGVLRNLIVEHFWCAPGQESAARALWEDTRWACRDRGTNLVFTGDARDPLRRVLGIRPWSPTTSFVSAVRADPPARPDGPLVEPMM